MATQIIVLGSINTDLVIKSPTLPKPGETVLGGEFLQADGGKGANQAVAAARTATSLVKFIAAVGDDTFGKSSLDSLLRENLDCDAIKIVPSAASGVALIMVDDDGENSISVASGANLQLTPDDVESIDFEVFQQAKVFVACLESPLETVVAGLRRAKDAGVLTILNPAPAMKEIVDSKILGLVDILTPNESELGLLTGNDTNTLAECVAAARKLQTMGAGTVIATRGAEGCVIVEAESESIIPAFSVNAVDSTAAGDAFNGALATALSEAKPIEDAVRWASAAAALSVTRLGAQPSLPSREEVETFLASN